MHDHIDDASAFLMGQWRQAREGGWHVNGTSVVHFIEVAFAGYLPLRLDDAQ